MPSGAQLVRRLRGPFRTPVCKMDVGRDFRCTAGLENLPIVGNPRWEDCPPQGLLEEVLYILYVYMLSGEHGSESWILSPSPGDFLLSQVSWDISNCYKRQTIQVRLGGTYPQKHAPYHHANLVAKRFSSNDSTPPTTQSPKSDNKSRPDKGSNVKMQSQNTKAVERLARPWNKKQINQSGWGVEERYWAMDRWLAQEIGEEPWNSIDAFNVGQTTSIEKNTLGSDKTGSDGTSTKILWGSASEHD